MDREELISTLRRLRKETGLNQGEFADRIGFCEQSVANFETKRHYADNVQRIAFDIANGLGFDIDMRLVPAGKRRCRWKKVDVNEYKNICKKFTYIDDSLDWKYCPNCGRIIEII